MGKITDLENQIEVLYEHYIKTSSHDTRSDIMEKIHALEVKILQERSRRKKYHAGGLEEISTISINN